VTYLGWDQIEGLVEKAGKRLLPKLKKIMKTHKGFYVYGVPRGGAIPAMLLTQWLINRGLQCKLLPAHMKVYRDNLPTLVIDDIVDSGSTLQRFIDDGFIVEALCRSSVAPSYYAKLPGFNEWVTFPWEGEADGGPEDNVRRLLQFIGEDQARDGLLDTPKRVVKALGEMTKGYSEDPKAILSRTFEQSHDEMVMLKNISFTSLCEHHMMPFIGTATVGYIPGKKVVGISKLARVVNCFARRLQIQERLTDQIALAIATNLKPRGVGVVIRASHHCMICRGVEQHTTEMVTSCMLGYLRNKPEARNEFMLLAK
jgi:GTP cyclohydrolase I